MVRQFFQCAIWVTGLLVLAGAGEVYSIDSDPFRRLTSKQRVYANPGIRFGTRKKTVKRKTERIRRAIRKKKKKVFAKSFWREPEEIDGRPRIVIDLSRQLARFYWGGKVVGQSPISSGKKGYETPLGSYAVLEKAKKHFSNLYGSFVNSSGRVVGHGKAKDTPPRGTRYRPAPMPYFIRLTHSGVGLHSGPLPGYPASHGCIRMPYKMARLFYQNIPLGGQVDVVD